jgi:dienelactone hydrolase
VDGAIEWVGRRVIRAGGAESGMVERSFRLARATAVIPGVLWLPHSPTSVPRLVLLGHGGSGHKASARNVGLACWFASHAGLAALAIDGPYHGDRVAAPMAAAEYQARMAAEGIDAVLDRLTDEWQATIDALGALRMVDTGNLGYLGMSMGTRFGLPLAARLGDRLRCVVFGKFGLQQASFMPKGLDVPARVASDARRVAAPTLFHLQWDDEIFPRDGQLALFDLLGSPDKGSRDKQLTAFTGRHAETRPEAIALWRDFIARHLTAITPPP